MSNIKISEMTEATSLNDNDLLTIVQGGLNKKITKKNAIGDIVTALNNPTKTTTEGESLSINNTRVGNIDWQFYGNTTQLTTTGKNISYTTENNGGAINFLQGNEVNIINPTTYYYNSKFNLKDDASKSGKTYTIYTLANGTIGNANVDFQIAKTGNSYAFLTRLSANTTYTNSVHVATVNLASNEVFTAMLINVTQSITANVNIKFMIVEGSYTAQTIGDYEPYTAGASPNPSYPQPVNVVSGGNNLYIEGINKFNFEGFKSGSNATITGTADDFTYSGASVTTQYYYHFKPNTYYHIGGTWNTTYGNFRLRIIYTNSDSTMIVQDYSSASASGTININSSNTLTIQSIEFTTWTTGNITLKDFRIVEGNTDKDFEPYQSQTFSLNLGANLFDLQSTWLNSTNSSTGGMFGQVLSNNKIYISGVSTGYAGFYGRNYSETKVFLTAKAGHTYRLMVNVENKTGDNEVRFYMGHTSGNDWNITGINKSGLYYKDYTLTNDINFTQYSFIGSVAATTERVASTMSVAIYDITANIINDFQPYFTPIELCKIDCYETNFSRTTTYQDYLYNTGDKWYKHQEVGKMILTGNESDWAAFSVNYEYQLPFETKASFDSDGVFMTGLYSSHFKNTAQSSVDMSNFSFTFFASSGYRWFRFRYNEKTSLADFKTWLASNNVTMYYPLKASQEEEITDTTTLYYLNTIKTFAQSYYGTTNIIITSSELQPTMKVQTLDKIGG